MKEKVPYVITGKDLDYLSDMFNWNYGANKNVKNSVCCVEDKEIAKLLEKAGNLFCENMKKVLSILEGGQHE